MKGGGRTAPGRRGWMGYTSASERENEQIRERQLLSLSLSLSLQGRWGERGWIKASTRGGNKERTKKVEEVGGGGWVPWSALIGSTWSDEKFNHPPIPTRSNALSLPPLPLAHLHLLLLFALSFSVSRAIRTIVHPFTRRPDSHQMNLPHIYAHPRCLHVQDEETKLNRADFNRRLRKHLASISP